MALPGSTFLNLLQSVADDFARTDFLSATPVPTDIAYKYALQAIAYFQPRVFMPNQGYLQWVTTIAGQNLYALPPDFTVDGQILQTQFGRILPLEKKSEFEINRMDVQVPPVIGQAMAYCIYGTAAQIYSNLPAWSASFNYSGSGAFTVVDSNGNVQRIFSAGTSGGSAPTWSSTLGGLTTDGGVTWRCVYIVTGSSGPVLRVWPWPDTGYAMTAVYQNKIPAPTSVNTSNFWTVEGEAMIRFWTEGLIRKNVMRTQDFQNDFDTAMIEFNSLSGMVRRQSATGHAKPVYL
jgi:hypothetical protein